METAEKDREDAYTYLSAMLDQDFDIAQFKYSETVTIKSTWTNLKFNNIVPFSATVTKNGTEYRDGQGWIIDFMNGRIKTDTPLSDYTDYIKADDSITVSYRFSAKFLKYGAV